MWYTDFGALVLSVYVLDRYGRNRDVVLGYLREAIKLFWTFRVPWRWTYTAGTVADCKRHMSKNVIDICLL